MVTELSAFVERRLLTTDEGNGSGVIGVAHEKFLSAWPPLAQAITAAASALRARRAVEHAATEWHENDRPPARLWGGGQLAATVTDTGARIRAGTALTDTAPKSGSTRWLPQRHRALVSDRVDLSRKAREFLHASIRRDRSRRLRTITVLSVSLVVALAAAGFAFIQQSTAEDRQLLATARQLVAQADSVRNTDPRTALQLAIAAQRIHPSSAPITRLTNTLTTTHCLGALTGHTNSASSVAFAPGGRHRRRRQRRQHRDLVGRQRPGPAPPPGSTTDRPHRCDVVSGVRPGRTHPRHRQQRRHSDPVGLG